MTLSLKSMTRLLIVLAGLMLLTTGCSDNDVTAPESGPVVIADDPLEDALKSMDDRTPADPQDRLARLAEYLGLDEDQLAALTIAYTEFRDGMADLHTQVADGELAMEEARAAAAVLRDAFEAELQVILTAEQWDLLQEMRDAGRRGERHEHQHRYPNAIWGSWLEEIGADADQVAAILEALEVLHLGMQDLRAQVRDGSLTMEEARAAAEALRADFDAALQTILTEEQYQALLELRPDCGGPRHR